MKIPFSNTLLANDNCIACHTVEGRPEFEYVPNSNFRKVGLFNCKFVELGIACVSCHGPGRKHAEAHRHTGKPTSTSGKSTHDPSIINPARLDTRKSAAVCGQCHADFFPAELVDFHKEGFSYSTP